MNNPRSPGLRLQSSFRHSLRGCCLPDIVHNVLTVRSFFLCFQLLCRIPLLYILRVYSPLPCSGTCWPTIAIHLENAKMRSGFAVQENHVQSTGELKAYSRMRKPAAVRFFVAQVFHLNVLQWHEHPEDPTRQNTRPEVVPPPGTIRLHRSGNLRGRLLPSRQPTSWAKISLSDVIPTETPTTQSNDDRRILNVKRQVVHCRQAVRYTSNKNHPNSMSTG
jgi:hypothetical protein